MSFLTSHKPGAVALRTSLLYMGLAGLWILFSDQLLAEWVEDRHKLMHLEIYKGWFFVVFTGVIFYITLRQLLASEAHKIGLLEKAEALTHVQNKTLEMIAGGQPLSATLEHLLRGVEAQSPELLGSILLVDAEGFRLQHIAGPSLPADYIAAIDGAAIGPRAGSCGTAAHRGSPVFVSDIANDPLWENFKHLALPHGLRACWSTPIFDERKKVLGTFAIYQRQPGLPDENNVRTIELVTHTAATAISKQRAEKKLRESEEQFRTLVEQASDAIFVHDAAGKLLDVNQSACDSLGYSRPELLQLTVSEVVAGFSPEELQLLWKQLQSGQSHLLRARHRRKDGTTFPVEVSLGSYQFHGQRRLAAVARDISERAKYEEQLAHSIALLRTVVDLAPDFIFVKDKEGRYLVANESLARCYGRQPAEMLCRTDADFVPAELATFFRAAELRVLADRANPFSTFEDTIGYPDGQTRTVVTNMAAFRDAQGQVSGVVGIGRDITRRKQMEEELRQAGERTKFYMDRMPQAFIAWDRNFCVAEWNAAAEAIFGWSAEESIGKNAYDFLVPADIKPQVEAVWHDIFVSGSLAGQSINENVTKDGRRITCDWRNAPWRDGAGQICGCLSIVTDITEKLRAEKTREDLEAQLRQAQKMEAIGQLSGGIAHDFNNILTVIQGNADLLLDPSPDPAEIRDCGRQIARAAERAAGLTRQLLMFARKQQMQPVNLNLNESVSQMTKMLQRILGEDIVLRSEYAPALPLIHADAGMIEQIILNLAVNARDAMTAGGRLTLRTTVENMKRQGGPANAPAEPHVCLSVADTGNGIAPEILPHIFEPFFTTKEVGKGTGLGLATVYGIVEQHRGQIVTRSEPGKGTTFSIGFPALTEAELAWAQPPKNTSLPRGTETILLVEDETPLRAFVRDLLQRCGYTVLEAGTGAAALKLWPTARDRIQLVFTDVVLPGKINGFDLGQRLLADKPSLKIIYTSGYTRNLEERQPAPVAGVNFLRKPFKPEELAEIIRKNLDGDIAGR